MIFDRRAAERDAVHGAQPPSALGGRAGVVLDGLGFVQHHGRQFQLGQGRDVEPQRAVGREHDVHFAKRLLDLAAIRPPMRVDAQLRRETRGLGAPIGEQRARHDHQ